MFQCDCPPDSCAEHVRCYLAGKREAGDHLALKFTPLIWRIVQRVLGPGRREEWEDASQAIFLRLFANLDKWEGRCPFCRWLAVVAARRAIDQGRAEAPALVSLPVEGVADPRCARPHQETLERIEQVVARFPESWRRVWGLWAQGASREEMARQAGRSLRTVHYWLAEMLDQVREEVGEEMDGSV